MKKPTKLTIAQACDEWLLKCRQRVTGGHMPYNTMYASASMMKNHVLPFLGTVSLASLDAPMVQKWIDDMAFHPVSPRTGPTQIAAVMALRRMLTDYQRTGAIQVNIIKQVKPQFYKGDQKPKTVLVPTRDELRLILSNDLPPNVDRPHHYNRVTCKVEGENPNYLYGRYPILNLRFRVFVNIAILCGLRQSEILGLHWENIDFDTDTIHVEWQINRISKISRPKSKAGIRDVPMARKVKAILKEWKIATHTNTLGLVFADEYGLPLKRVAIERPWRKFRRGFNLNPEYTFHSLRHATVSLLREQGVEVEEISKIIGHAHPSTTLDFYSHIFEDASKGRRAVVDMEKALIG